MLKEFTFWIEIDEIKYSLAQMRKIAKEFTDENSAHFNELQRTVTSEMAYRDNVFGDTWNNLGKVKVMNIVNKKNKEEKVK